MNSNRKLRSALPEGSQEALPSHFERGLGSPSARLQEPPHLYRTEADEEVEQPLPNLQHSASRSGGADMLGDGILNTSSRVTSIAPASTGQRVRMRFSDLQRDVMLHGISPIAFLPLLGLEGYIRKGRSHLLSAYPKMGKTELMLQAIQQWTDEEVLYFTEESQETWEDRAYELGQHGESIDNLELVFALGLEPEVVLKYMEALPASVVIIDTIRDVLRPEDENDNAKVANCLRPYIALAREKQQTLILLHHDSKRGGKEGRGVSGAHAFIGTVDIFLELESGRTATQRKLSGRGRIKPIEDLTYERHDDGTMVALDSGLTGTTRQVLAAVTFDWLPTSAIAESAGVSTAHTPRELKKLCLLDLVEREPPISQAVTGKTVKWRLKAEVE